MLSGSMRDTPDRAIPFRIAEGGIARLLPCFHRYRVRIADIPLLCWGGIVPPLRMLSQGKRSEKGEGVSQPIGHVETRQPPYRAIEGYR